MFEASEENKAEVDAIVDSGATIMGRNMFGPVRDEWDRDWRGWWGPNPPYHAPVFVLTHFPHEPIPMEGGTTFHFVTDGIHAALEQARAAAGDRNISIAGGATTVNQFLAAGLLDELRLHVTPCILGAGSACSTACRPRSWSGSRCELVARHAHHLPAGAFVAAVSGWNERANAVGPR